MLRSHFLSAEGLTGVILVCRNRLRVIVTNEGNGADGDNVTARHVATPHREGVNFEDVDDALRFCRGPRPEVDIEVCVFTTGVAPQGEEGRGISNHPADPRRTPSSEATCRQCALSRGRA